VFLNRASRNITMILLVCKFCAIPLFVSLLLASTDSRSQETIFYSEYVNRFSKQNKNNTRKCDHKMHMRPTMFASERQMYE
jgi:hypothetical protein